MVLFSRHPFFLFFAAVGTIFCLNAFARINAPVGTLNLPLRAALSEKGALVFLKPLTIEGHFSDGTPFFTRTVSYQNTVTESGLACSAIYDTSNFDSTTVQSTPGKNIQFSANQSIPYLADDSSNPPFSTQPLTDGMILQRVSLKFDSFTSSILFLNCEGVFKPEVVLTVSNFEEATAGIMSLRVTP